jgi:hypothetical protein
VMRNSTLWLTHQQLLADQRIARDVDDVLQHLAPRLRRKLAQAAAAYDLLRFGSKQEQHVDAQARETDGRTIPG